jgi:hypothetical protein
MCKKQFHTNFQQIKLVHECNPSLKSVRIFASMLQEIQHIPEIDYTYNTTIRKINATFFILEQCAILFDFQKSFFNSRQTKINQKSEELLLHTFVA